MYSDEFNQGMEDFMRSYDHDTDDWDIHPCDHDAHVMDLDNLMYMHDHDAHVWDYKDHQEWVHIQF